MNTEPKHPDVTVQLTGPTVGRRIGRAMARDVLAESMPREWTGLDPQDADQIPAGIDVAAVEGTTSCTAEPLTDMMSTVQWALGGRLLF